MDGSTPEPSSKSARTELLAPASPPVACHCWACAADVAEADEFCESCGARQPARHANVWAALVVADRAQFARVGLPGMQFPDGRVATPILLVAEQVWICRGALAGLGPAIDLSGPLADPGVSGRHAILRRTAAGTYSVADVGSANGTWLNDGTEPIPPLSEVELADGDRLRIGAWTTITITRAGGSTT